MFVIRLIQAFEEHGISYALAGGFAVALHGAVRGTLDVDLIIPQTKESYTRAEAALHSIGLECRLPVSAKEVFQFRQEYIKKKNMLAWSFYNPDRPSELVDIIITHDLRKLKTRTISFGRHRIKILAIKELIQMKQKSGRPQDKADAQALLQIQEERKK